MANRIPTVALPIAVELRPVKPGQIDHEPLSGADDPVVFTRNPGRWEGRLALQRVGVGDESIGQQVEAWLAGLDGVSVTGEIQIYRPVVPVVGVVTVTAMTVGDGYLEITPSVTVAGAAVGQFLRINGRMFMVTAIQENLNPQALRLWPPAPLDVANGDALVRGEWLRIRRSGDPGVLIRRPSSYGPWQLDFRENPRL